VSRPTHRPFFREYSIPFQNYFSNSPQRQVFNHLSYSLGASIRTEQNSTHITSHSILCQHLERGIIPPIQPWVHIYTYTYRHIILPAIYLFPTYLLSTLPLLSPSIPISHSLDFSHHTANKSIHTRTKYHPMKQAIVYAAHLILSFPSNPNATQT